MSDTLYSIIPLEPKNEYSPPKFLATERDKLSPRLDVEALIDKRFWDFKYPNFYSSEANAKKAWKVYLKEHIENLKDLIATKSEEIADWKSDLGLWKQLLDKTT